MWVFQEDEDILGLFFAFLEVGVLFEIEEVVQPLQPALLLSGPMGAFHLQFLVLFGYGLGERLLMQLAGFLPSAKNVHVCGRSDFGHAFLQVFDVVSFVPDSLQFCKKRPFLRVGQDGRFLFWLQVGLEGEWVVGVFQVGVVVLQPPLQSLAGLCVQLQLLVYLSHAFVGKDNPVALAEEVDLGDVGHEESRIEGGAGGREGLLVGRGGGLRLGQLVEQSSALGDDGLALFEELAGGTGGTSSLHFNDALNLYYNYLKENLAPYGPNYIAISQGGKIDPDSSLPSELIPYMLLPSSLPHIIICLVGWLEIILQLMGSKPSRSSIKIDFREHFKTQKQLVIEQEVTKGTRPQRGRAKQSGQRSSTIFHINHETIENRPHSGLHFNQETTAKNSNIRNPRAKSAGRLMDNRVKIPSDKYPYCCIGLLQVQFENRRIRGTAFLISSNWLLTCAHNVYDRGEKRMGSQATFTLGLQQKEEIIRENGKEIRTKVDVGENIEISAWRVPDQYMNGSDEQAELYDFALVKLKNFHNLEEKYGYFGLDSVWSFQRTQAFSELIVAGYPRQVKGVSGKCKSLVQARGQWAEIMNDDTLSKNERLLYVNYHIYTSPGQSGSPIFYETKEKEYFMVGIHTLGGDEENSGILVTPRTRQIINGWIEEMKTIFDISNRNIGNQGMEDFIANFMQMAEKITELQLANNRIGPEGIRFLMGTKWPNLKLLNLENNNIKVEGAKYLAHPSNGWKALEYLNLNNTMIGDEGCCALLQNRTWLKLKELHLKRCLLSRTTVSQIALKDWACLQTLNLGINDLSSAEIKLLFSPIHDTQGKSERRRFSQLKNLNLAKNPIGNDGIRAVVQAQLELFSLNITGIGINAQGMEVLASRKWLLLRKLHLDWNKEISIEGISFLRPEMFPCLSYANLDWTTLGAQGVRVFMSHDWKTLRNISLNHNYLGDQGLNDMRSLQTLEVLVLEGNNLTTDGVKAFAEKAEWSQLLQLRLRSNHIKKNGFLNIVTRLKDLNYLDINNNGLDAHEKREIREVAGRTSPNLHIQVDMGQEADYT